MSITNPDLLYPLFDKNRDETLLVSYDGFIKNISEGLVVAMMVERALWLDKYPQLNKFESLSDNIYDEASLYFPMDYMRMLSDNKRSDEDIRNDIKLLRKKDILLYQQTTTFEFALYKLLKEQFLRSCYFFKEEEFLPYEIEYIGETFKNDITKIHVISGDINEAYKEILPTTCFVNRLDDAQNIIKTFTPPKVNTLFIVRNTINTVYKNSDNIFQYYDDIVKTVNAVNAAKTHGIGLMYTFKQEDVEQIIPVG